MSADSHTETGWRHFVQADWASARDAFAAALEEHPGDPDALDGLGQSLWWLGEREAGVDRRREAYAGYQRQGDSLKAGGVAIYLAAEHRIDGRDAEAAGWLARGRRLLADAGPVGERAWLEVEEAKRAADPVEAERHARAALDIAHTLGDSGVECMALAQLGQAAVRQGRGEEGVALLDEAMTVALGETSDPLACSDACCTTLVVCDRLADLDRAAQWCEAVIEFTDRRRYTPIQSWCRGIFGGVLVRAGEWARAEAVLQDALRRQGDRRRQGRRVALAVLADLRLRQGRPEEAAQLLEGMEGVPVALAPLVRLHLARGDAPLAQALLERQADVVADDTDVLAGAVALARGDLRAAAACADRLRALAGERGRDDLRAEAAFLAGRVAAEQGDVAAAVRELEAAAVGFGEVRYPLEEGRARLALAELQAAAGSPLALAAARAARDAFERLGARADADRAAALLRDLGAGGRTAKRGDRDELTAREREVLELIVAGLSNAQIAERLVIAPKTAEHHVGRVLGKLGVRSRAEAAVHAVREGL